MRSKHLRVEVAGFTINDYRINKGHLELRMLDPCGRSYTGCACERCGQLATAWVLTARSVLDASLGTSIAEPMETPGSAPITTEQIRGAFRHLGHAVTELAPVLSMAGGTGAASAPTPRICAGCGKPVSQSARFCPACGRTALGQEFCMNCNSTVDPETNFCPKCGAKVAWVRGGGTPSLDIGRVR